MSRIFDADPQWTPEAARMLDACVPREPLEVPEREFRLLYRLYVQVSHEALNGRLTGPAVETVRALQKYYGEEGR